MKIKYVSINNRKKCIEIETAKETFTLPFSKLRLRPSLKNRVTKICVDSELGNEGITYLLSSGEEDSIHIDAFIDYNKRA